MRAFDQKGDDDDNPDINKYMGYGDLKVQYRLNDKQNVYSVLRYNPKSGRGAVEAAYTFPIKRQTQRRCPRFPRLRRKPD